MRLSSRNRSVPGDSYTLRTVLSGRKLKIALERLGYSILSGRDVLMKLGYSGKEASKKIRIACEKVPAFYRCIFGRCRFCYKDEEGEEKLLVMFEDINDHISGLEEFYNEESDKEVPFPDATKLPSMLVINSYSPRTVMTRELREMINELTE